MEVILQGRIDGYGVETEQLALAAKMGLRVSEVPVQISYGDAENTSKKHPLFHGFELVETILSLFLEKRPLLLLGMPGAILALLGVLVGAYSLWYFNITRYFSIPMTLISIGGIMIGLILLIFSFLLYSIARSRR